MSLLNALDLIGVFFFAISGVLTAATRKMDLFGATVIAFVTCLGGGTIRDTLLNQYPIFWMENPNYLIIIISTSLLTFFTLKNIQNFTRFFLIPDALGLGVFTLIGLQKAISLGATPMVAILMAMITATGGGLIRDILCNRVPVIFRNQEIYATACLLGAGLYFILLEFSVPIEIIMPVTALSVAAIRIASFKFGLKMPKVVTD